MVMDGWGDIVPKSLLFNTKGVLKFKDCSKPYEQSGERRVIVKEIEFENKHYVSKPIYIVKNSSINTKKKISKLFESMKDFSHPNIVDLVGVLPYAHSILIKENSVPADRQILWAIYHKYTGNLLEHLKNLIFPISITTILSILNQVCAGIQFLHKKGVSIGNIGLGNILYSKEQSLYKISDPFESLTKFVTGEDKILQSSKEKDVFDFGKLIVNLCLLKKNENGGIVYEGTMQRALNSFPCLSRLISMCLIEDHTKRIPISTAMRTIKDLIESHTIHPGFSEDSLPQPVTSLLPTHPVLHDYQVPWENTQEEEDTASESLSDVDFKRDKISPGKENRRILLSDESEESMNDEVESTKSEDSYSSSDGDMAYSIRITSKSGSLKRLRGESSSSDESPKKIVAFSKDDRPIKAKKLEVKKASVPRYLSKEQVTENAKQALFKGQISKAIFYALKAAKHGCVNAYCLLGLIYFDGYNYQQSFKISYLFFKYAAVKNDPFALTMIAYGLFYGYGVKRNLSRALELGEQAFNILIELEKQEDYNPNNFHLLAKGILHAERLGTPVDEDPITSKQNAVTFLSAVAENGFVSANYFLGRIYDQNLSPIQPNAYVYKFDAIRFYTLAADCGVYFAQKNLSKLYGTNPEKNLSLATFYIDKANTQAEPGNSLKVDLQEQRNNKDCNN